MWTELRDIFRQGGPGIWRDAAHDLAGALTVAALLVLGLHLPALF
jgi:hypothetical protein